MERVNVESCEDRLQIAMHRARYDFVLDRLPAGETILEVGVGAGVFSQELMAKGVSYKGIDYDKETADAARHRSGGKADIIQADARKLPFGGDQFSFIVCLEVLEHLGDWKAGVRNIHRCLKADGKVIISVPYRRVGGKSESNPYHLYEPGEHELVSLFTELFTDVEVYYQYFLETRLMTAARQLHVRRLLGLHRIYADLSAGEPHAIARLKIGHESKGKTMAVILVAKGKK
jgi:2-polyprenyl-3-methyl-5-hydroxy-6-metoxy-1,4-benzoquinol methylase